MRLLLDFDSDSLRASRIANDDDSYTAFMMIDGNGAMMVTLSATIRIGSGK